MTNLRLRRTCIAGQYRDDDFCVYDEGVRVGRILHAATPQGARWAWHVSVAEPVPAWCNGRAATLDEARCAFRVAWAKFKPGISVAQMRRHREQRVMEGRRRE